jgi:dienelactone hydrolase
LPLFFSPFFAAEQQTFANLIQAEAAGLTLSAFLHHLLNPNLLNQTDRVEKMKRGIAVLVCVCALLGTFYFAISKWGIHHDALNLFDTARQRPVGVDLAVRTDYEMKANAGYWKLPVAIISNGNTVKNTEYSFLANVLAARGYLVASIQQDLPTDPPLMTKVGMPYVGRLGVYQKGEANIQFVLGQLKKMQPNADYGHLTLVGHSNGGDTAMYYAQQHPDVVAKVITLDNLRVPFVHTDKMKILSFRSHDPNFQTDPGVLPTATQAKAEGIDIIRTQFQHTDMSDRGPYSVRERIQATLDSFLGGDGSSSELAPAPTDNPIVTNAGAPLP